MWNGPGDGEAGRYSCACGCSAHSAAESAKDSVCFFTISGLAARFFATVRKTEGCSVDITLTAARIEQMQERSGLFIPICIIK